MILWVYVLNFVKRAILSMKPYEIFVGDLSSLLNVLREINYGRFNSQLIFCFFQYLSSESIFLFCSDMKFVIIF